MGENEVEQLFLPISHFSAFFLVAFVVVACDMKQPVDNKGKEPLKEMCV